MSPVAVDVGELSITNEALIWLNILVTCDVILTRLCTEKGAATNGAIK